MRLKNIKGASEKILEGKYFISNPKDYRGKWNKLFNNNNPIYIEIGMGKGNFIIKNAIANPNINYLGIEMYDSVILRAVEKTNELELNNLYLIRMDARLIEEVFDKEINLIYLNFSDPWPKERHTKRRLTSPRFLARYDSIFKDKKHIIMKTDNIDLFNYSVESLKEYGYNINDISNDLHSYKDNIITTEYEDKFTSKGINENPNYPDYERLEFLGDAVLKIIISEYLYKERHLEEGTMTRMRASYVCEEACATYAKEIGLDLDIKVGTGEEINQTILADVFEAFVAALYLDQGFEFTRSFVLNIILKYIEKEVDFLHDYKSTLQELAQTVKKSIIYEVVDEEGPAHNKKFTSIVKVDGIIMGRGTAGSKKASEQEAAKDALSKRAGIK